MKQIFSSSPNSRVYFSGALREECEYNSETLKADLC